MDNIKLRELERRISNIEKQLSNPTYCYYLSEKISGKSDIKHQFEYSFKVQANTTLKIEICAELAQFTPYVMQISVHGAQVLAQAVTQENQVVEVVLPFEKGENSIQVELVSEQTFTVKKCVLRTCGNLSRCEGEYILQALNESDKSVILFIANGVATLQEYKNGEFTLLLEEKGIKSGAICKMGETYLLTLVYADGKGVLKQLTSDFAVDYYKTLDSELISVCALSGEIPAVFAVKGNRVYRYDIEEMLFFKRRITGYTGKKLKSNPNVSGYIIIVDYDGSGKLVSV